MTGIWGNIGCVSRYKYPVENSKSDRRERFLPRSKLKLRSAALFAPILRSSLHTLLLLIDTRILSRILADKLAQTHRCLQSQLDKPSQMIQRTLPNRTFSSGCSCDRREHILPPFLFFLSHAPASIASLMSTAIFTLKAGFLRPLGGFTWRWYCIDCS